MLDFSNKPFNLFCGDSLEILKQLPDNSVDSIVTDPPYGLNKEPDMNEVLQHWMNGDDYKAKGGGFMGKTWDSFVPGPAIWKECLRVLKPGGHLLAFFGSRTYDMGTLAIRLAGFEIRDQIMWLYGCYSEDTQVLTNRGWLHYTELTLNDKILQWNNTTNKLSFANPLDIYVYDAPPTMISFKNRHTDQLLTKNHRVYSQVKKHSRNQFESGFGVYEAKEMKKHWVKNMPLAGELPDGIEVKSPYVVGWWLTDAWVHTDGKACMFSQAKPKTLEKLINALKNEDCSFSEYIKKRNNPRHKDEYTLYVTGVLAEYLLTAFPERELTWDVLTWDFDSRMALLEGLLDGDGSRNENQYSETFWSQKPTRLDIVSALCVTLNIRNHIDYKKGCVYLNRKTNTTQLQNRHTCDETSYNGSKVWCLKTETGAFVVRRNGKPFISGNSGFPKSMDVSKAIGKAAGVEREIIGVKPGHEEFANRKTKGHMNFKDGSEGFDRPWMHDEEKRSRYHLATAPGTEAAKQWQGWGTALKPAHEPICVARKPLVGTVTANVLEYGTGALNIDGCRVEPTGESRERIGEQSQERRYTENGGTNFAAKPGIRGGDPQGRWPANVIHDGSDEVLSGFPQSSVTGKRSGRSKGANVEGTTWLPQNHQSTEYTDSGSAARFFYCAKASRLDRNEGLDDPGPQFKHGVTLRQVENAETRGNNHPTVKPTALMNYLIRLVTPPNGVVLDPFNGSGSTGKAAMLNDFKYIGIDLSQEYIEISEKRIQYAIDNKDAIIERMAGKETKKQEFNAKAKNMTTDLTEQRKPTLSKFFSIEDSE